MFSSLRLSASRLLSSPGRRPGGHSGIAQSPSHSGCPLCPPDPGSSPQSSSWTSSRPDAGGVGQGEREPGPWCLHGRWPRCRPARPGGRVAHCMEPRVRALGAGDAGVGVEQVPERMLFWEEGQRPRLRFGQRGLGFFFFFLFFSLVDSF